MNKSNTIEVMTLTKMGSQKHYPIDKWSPIVEPKMKKHLPIGGVQSSTMP
jgi:hypothetical protein